MRKIFLIFLTLLTLSLQAKAAPVTAEQAAQLYEQKDYMAAANAYTQLLADTLATQGDAQLTATYHYNAANCYYRLKNYAEAVYGYQQALRLEPYDKDAAFNLQLAQSKLTDQFNEPSQMLFSVFFRSLMLSMSASAWGGWALALLIVGIALALGIRLVDRTLIRKLLLSLSALALICSLAAFALAYAEHNHAFPEKQGVIMQGTLQAYSTPTTTTKPLRELHEGVLLNIEDAQPNGWLQVVLPDGSEAWLKPAAEQVKLLK